MRKAPRWPPRAKQNSPVGSASVLDQALKMEGPAIVDCVVPADELPKLPHIELEKIENFAKAKVRETILAVTGG
jgi:pyruvate dehydrogenase (quinone)